MKLKLHSKIFINIGVIVLMTILQYKIFNSIEFENLENNLTILLCIINPIAIIISGIISGKEIKKIFLIQLIIPMIPAIVYYNIFEKITNTILIYLWIYIGIEIWIILTNTLVKNKKIKVLLNVILSIILILNVFISRETLIKNCKSNIKNKYEICTGKLSEVYDKYISIAYPISIFETVPFNSEESYICSEDGKAIDISKIRVADEVYVKMEFGSGMKITKCKVHQIFKDGFFVAITTYDLERYVIRKDNINQVKDKNGKIINVDEIKKDDNLYIVNKKSENDPADPHTVGKHYLHNVRLIKIID